MKKLLLLGALALAGFTSKAETVEINADRSNWTITACSNAGGIEGAVSGYVSAMIDDNLSTYYHQHWNDDTDRGTHWFIVDMGSEQEIHGIDIWGRQGHDNGHILEGKIYASTTPFEAFADHDAAKAYYDANDDNVGEIHYTLANDTRNDVQSVRFESMTARYILVLTDQTSNNHLCVAEINALTTVEMESRVNLDPTNWVVDVCSEAGVLEGANGGYRANMFDNNLSTYFHQDWNEDKPNDAYHWMMIDLGKTEQIDGFKYWRRQNNPNGQWLAGKVYVSNEPFTAFASHNGENNAAKAYFENSENSAAGEFNFSYAENPNDERMCTFPAAANGRYVLVIISDPGTAGGGRNFCCAEFKLFKDVDIQSATVAHLWEDRVRNSAVTTKAGYLKALGSYLNKEFPSFAMPDDATVDNIYDKIAAVRNATQAYIDSFNGQLIYIRHASRRGNAYLAAIPTGNGIKLNTIAEPTADAAWSIGFLNGQDGFYLYNRTAAAYIATTNNRPVASLNQVQLLSSSLASDGSLELVSHEVPTQMFNVDNSSNDLVWYSADDGSKWTAVATSGDEMVYVNPEASTADAPKYYRIINARWIYNGDSCNMAVKGEDQAGNGNGEVITRSSATMPGIYWRIEDNGDGKKLISLTGYEFTIANNVTATDNGSKIYLIEQTADQFHGVKAYAISNTATQGNASCLDVSGINAGSFCWSPTVEGRGNGNNGSAWYFLPASDAEIANATATYVAGVKDRMILADESLSSVFGTEFYNGLGDRMYMGESTISAVNAAKASGNYAKTNDNYAAVNAAVAAKAPELVDRHFLIHNRNTDYSHCYMTVATHVTEATEDTEAVTTYATATTSDASDVNALWSFVPQGEGYLMTSAATGKSLTFTTETSVEIPLEDEGLPYSIAYNAKIPGFYFTLLPTESISNVSYYSVHQGGEDLVCKWTAGDIPGSHWYLEGLNYVDIDVTALEEGHQIVLPEGVTLNTHASAANHAMTIAPKAADQYDARRVAAVDGVHTITADHFSGNTVTLEGLEPGKYNVTAPAGMFLVNGKPSDAISQSFEVKADGSTTGVEEISAEVGEKVIYDLLGRRVNGNAKGLVIVNGKKTLLR